MHRLPSMRRPMPHASNNRDRIEHWTGCRLAAGRRPQPANFKEADAPAYSLSYTTHRCSYESAYDTGSRIERLMNERVQAGNFRQIRCVRAKTTKAPFGLERRNGRIQGPLSVSKRSREPCARVQIKVPQNRAKRGGQVYSEGSSRR
jgi:hypothetical protein